MFTAFKATLSCAWTFLCSVETVLLVLVITSTITIMVLVITSFLDRILQVQPNWYTPTKLFGDSFYLFLHIKFFIFRPKVKLFFMQNFIKSIPNFDLSIGTQGSFIFFAVFTVLVFSLLIVSVFSFSFTQLMLFIYIFCLLFLTL